MSVFTNTQSNSPQQARSYTQGILDLLGDRDPRTVLAATAGELRRAVAGLNDDHQSTPEAPGKWSVRQVVRHLADGEIVWGWRMRLVLTADRPPITAYDQDAWASVLRYDAAPIDEALEEFAALRRTHLRLLDAAPASDLARFGVHSERGEESVHHMMKMYAGHDLLHLRQIARIRAAIGA